MNERIKELAVQAEEYSYKEYAKRETGYTREDFFTKKFAELIVKECAMLVDSLVQSGPVSEVQQRRNWAYMNCRDVILSRLGGEE